MSKTDPIPGRDAAVDIMRGLAILLMIGANMGPVLQEPHAFPVRFLGSLAAPAFIFLAGMMAGRGARPWPVVVKRAATLLVFAVFTDVAAWGIRPFLGVDVLYLMAIGGIAVRLLGNRGGPVRGAVILAVFLMAPALRDVLGYTPYPAELELVSGRVAVEVRNQSPVWQHYLIDGWFPVFPWLAVMLAGAEFARYGQANSCDRLSARNPFYVLAVILMAGGGILWRFFPGAMMDREGFSELFYPPFSGFMLAASGIVLLLFLLVQKAQRWRVWAPLKLLGRHSLFVYVVHSLVIGRLFLPWWQDRPLQGKSFALAYAVFVAGLFLATLGWRHGAEIRRRIPPPGATPK